ncbi:MAG: hypothetical protein QMC67_09480 [Candidatus Wallbacteria bacterium]
MVRFISGIILFIFMLAVFFRTEGTNIAVIFNISSAALIFFYIVIGVMASNWKFADLKRAITASLNNGQSDLKCVEIFTFLEKMVIFASIFGVLSGAVIILSFIGAGGERLGRALTITIMPAVHGVILYTFAYILKSRVKANLMM